MHRSGYGDELREEALHRFVRERRMRLSPESHFLGERPRAPFRIGKRVTQEEFAEHLGISRNWYSKLEAGAPAVFSIPLLNRLGDMLLLSGPERAELMQLAMPELATVVSRDSTKVYEALGAMRRSVERLYRATSEWEILQVAGEEARQLLPRCELIFARRIMAFEEAQFPQPGGSGTRRLSEATAYAFRRFTPEQFARLDVLWSHTPPGAVADRSGGLPTGVLLPSDAYPPDILRLVRLALREYGIDSDSAVAAHIRGSRASALVGGMSTRPHDVTKLERTMLSTIAEFASFALQ
jgi:transcriptional regulator with XRE-family HTH domain